MMHINDISVPFAFARRLVSTNEKSSSFFWLVFAYFGFEYILGLEGVESASLVASHIQVEVVFDGNTLSPVLYLTFQVEVDHDRYPSIHSIVCWSPVFH